MWQQLIIYNLLQEPPREKEARTWTTACSEAAGTQRWSRILGPTAEKTSFRRQWWTLSRGQWELNQLKLREEPAQSCERWLDRLERQSGGKDLRAKISFMKKVRWRISNCVVTGIYEIIPSIKRNGGLWLLIDRRWDKKKNKLSFCSFNGSLTPEDDPSSTFSQLIYRCAWQHEWCHWATARYTWTEPQNLIRSKDSSGLRWQ